MSMRCVLNPGDSGYYKIQFKPTTCGVFKHKYSVEVIGYRRTYTLECQASADIPSIYAEPDVLFEHITECRILTHQLDTNVFYKKNNIFDFGPALITECPEL